jgi:hypothetical protein
MGIVEQGGAKMRWALIVFFVFFLIGCVSRWEHSTKRTSEFYSDDRICQTETGDVSKGIEPGKERISYESCMWQLGWRKKQSVWFFDSVSE